MLCLILHCKGTESQKKASKCHSKVLEFLTVCPPISVIKLAEHGHSALDPVLRAPASGQHHGNDKIGGVACGGEGSLPLTGLVERAHIQILSLIHALLLSWMGEKEAKRQSQENEAISIQ